MIIAQINIGRSKLGTDHIIHIIQLCLEKNVDPPVSRNFTQDKGSALESPQNLQLYNIPHRTLTISLT